MMCDVAQAGVDAISLGCSKGGAFVDAAVLFGTPAQAAPRMAMYAKQRGHAVSKAGPRHPDTSPLQAYS